MVYSTGQYKGEVTSTPGTHVERGLDVGGLDEKWSNECSKSENRPNIVRDIPRHVGWTNAGLEVRSAKYL